MVDALHNAGGRGLRPLSRVCQPFSNLLASGGGVGTVHTLSDADGQPTHPGDQPVRPDNLRMAGPHSRDCSTRGGGRGGGEESRHACQVRGAPLPPNLANRGFRGGGRQGAEGRPCKRLDSRVGGGSWHQLRPSYPLCGPALQYRFNDDTCVEWSGRPLCISELHIALLSRGARTTSPSQINTSDFTHPPSGVRYPLS